MKRFIVPLLTAVMVVSIIFAGCMPAAAPPVTPPVTPPPVTPPEAKPLTVSETPTWETKFHRKGHPLCDPDLLMNPFGEDFAVKPDGTPYRFVTLHGTMLDDWSVLNHGIMKTLIERAGGIHNMLNSEWNIDEQTAQVHDIVSLGTADCIIIQPTQEDAMVPVCKEAMNAGIPVFTWCLDLSDPSAYVALFNRDWSGKYARGCDVNGEFLADYVERTGEHLYVFEIWGLRGMVTAQLRHEGFHKGIAGHPLITVLESGDTGWRNETIAEVTLEMFTARPELNAVFCMGGGDAGMIEALDEMGRLLPIGEPGRVIIATQADNNRAYEALEDNELDICAASSPWQLCDPLIKQAFRYVVLGQPVRQENYFDCVGVTPANMWEQFQFGGTCLFTFTPLDDFSGYPVLDSSEVGIEAPTKAERMELLGY